MNGIGALKLKNPGARPVKLVSLQHIAGVCQIVGGSALGVGHQVKLYVLLTKLLKKLHRPLSGNRIGRLHNHRLLRLLCKLHQLPAHPGFLFRPVQRVVHQSYPAGRQGPAVIVAGRTRKQLRPYTFKLAIALS